jgi:hypothetical protein
LYALAAAFLLIMGLYQSVPPYAESLWEAAVPVNAFAVDGSEAKSASAWGGFVAGCCAVSCVVLSGGGLLFVYVKQHFADACAALPFVRARHAAQRADDATHEEHTIMSLWPHQRLRLRLRIPCFAA